MGWGVLGKLLGFGAKETAEGIGTVLESVGSFAKDIREALTGEISPDKKAELLERAQQMEHELNQLQAQINVTEARHPAVFVAGWRPYIGWVLGTAIALYYIPQFAIASFLWVKMCLVANKLLPYPVQDISGLTQLVMGMLGLGVLRTYEKKIGVHGKH